MKILIKAGKGYSQMFLVTLDRKVVIREVVGLIHRMRRSKAIDVALSKGRLNKVVEAEDAQYFEADLILSEAGASWDIKK